MVPTGQEKIRKKKNFFRVRKKSGNVCLVEKSGKSQDILRSCQKISMNRYKVRIEPKCHVLAILAMAIFCHSIQTCILSIKKVVLISNQNIPRCIEF